MEMDPSLRAEVQTEIDAAQKDTRDSFYVWWWVNVALGFLIIVHLSLALSPALI